TLRDLDGRLLTTYGLEASNGAETWTWEKDHVYRGTSLLGAATPEAGPRAEHHFTLDHLGSPRVTTDGNGGTVAVHHYWGFGGDFGPSASDPESLRFTGHERDAHGPGTADDLDYMHARHCSPDLMRFLSVDPARSARQTVPQSWNRYAYSLNSPLKFVDPDGRESRVAVSMTPFFSDYEKNREVRQRAQGHIENSIPFIGGLVGKLFDSVVLSQILPASTDEFRQNVQATATEVGIPAATFSKKTAGATIDLFGRSHSIRPDVVLSGGRGGERVKNLVGPTSSVVKGSGKRVFVTNDSGEVVLDITRNRVKPVSPGRGFGPKREPTEEELRILEQILGGGT
ncbi:MAG: RHS repeat-associated core domain-containing protein, partial [Acidobacteriota bacterium]